MTHEQIAEVLKLHKKWLLGLADGVRADLSGTNLSNADLRNADLRGANLIDADLSNANLSDANLSNANLSDANLSDANLSGAILIGANLRDANLSDADLSNANLRHAILSNANLSDANLRNAILSNANLSDANLRNAILSNADLRYADLSGANLRHVKTNCLTVGYHIACPEEGAFVGYKKAGDKIVVLEILAEARRSSATSTKCRCDKAKVLRIENLDGTPAEVSEVSSDYDKKFKYRVGEVAESEFDENRWEECSKGIHFFINRNNAVTYQN